MRLPAVYVDLRSLANRTIGIRMAVGVALSLTERLLAPVAAWVLFRRTLGDQLAIAFCLGGVVTVRSLAQRMFSSRTEADLVDRVGGAVLGGDVLKASVLPDEDARLELVQAIYRASESLVHTVPVLVADALACGLLAAAVVWVEPARLVLFAVVMALVGAAALAVSRRVAEGASAGTWARQQRAYEALVDVLEGRLEIVACGLRQPFLDELRDRTRAWGAAGARLAALTGLSGRLPMLAIGAFVGVAVAIRGSHLGLVSVSLADVAVLASVTPAFAGVAQGVHTLARAERWIAVVARIQRLDAAPRGGALAPPALPAHIAFEGVSFAYLASGPTDAALRDVSFDWPPGRVLALAGPNGSGKSTCLRLLAALAPPRAGAVRVGAEPLERIDADVWRSRLAFLPQRPYLPPRSDIGAAIRWLAPGVTDEAILHALDRVELLGALRRGGRDPLTVRVDALSVGERQRVALARLLCRPASLFLLDEPDANLDRAGISVVAGVLVELSRRAMVVFAAHTPELLAVAAQVVTFDRGGVVAAESSAPSPHRNSA